MSGPPGLHCVLALCHCIACRPQTHVQETFLYSQLATRQRYLHLLQMYANAAIGRGSNSSTDTYTPLTFYRRLHRKGLPQKRWPGFACPCHLQCHLHHRAFANGFSPNRERLGGPTVWSLSLSACLFFLLSLSGNICSRIIKAPVSLLFLSYVVRWVLKKQRQKKKPLTNSMLCKVSVVLLSV